MKNPARISPAGSLALLVCRAICGDPVSIGSSPGLAFAGSRSRAQNSRLELRHKDRTGRRQVISLVTINHSRCHCPRHHFRTHQGFVASSTPLVCRPEMTDGRKARGRNAGGRKAPSVDEDLCGSDCATVGAFVAPAGPVSFVSDVGISIGSSQPTTSVGKRVPTGARLRIAPTDAPCEPRK